ncbi:RrF2 family transcriptional regulator [Clostridium thailandense]|uniref:Rrf2 family transcriptional regulator n=1 Tax=Clostridium thailandense TaxID=2794346 RepID=A0A949U009_9CLOT|nr:Rrf2 family transcriptional regulator [Clostridium thailandense]MBV7273734.1 Rrf2 family transcriptional regulator [Clostridium thailandense]MCH5137486.1 Rrf2 family transcriptional regulator [Clostridiaceae bacterium UIB06]
MAYSTEFSRAITICLLINQKMDEYGFEFVSANTISEFLKIPAPTVVRILRSLNAAGLTATKEGAKGGVLLAKPIAEITLLDIFLSVEHGSLFKMDIDFLIEDSRIDNLKSLIAGYMEDAENAMKESLKKTTLTDIAKSL